jgi:hypothetical protein
MLTQQPADGGVKEGASTHTLVSANLDSERYSQGKYQHPYHNRLRHSHGIAYRYDCGQQVERFPRELPSEGELGISLCRGQAAFRARAQTHQWYSARYIARLRSTIRT